MNIKFINKRHAAFIIAWLVIFVFCSILSGVTSSAVTPDDQDSPQTQAPAKTEQTTPPTTDKVDSPEPTDPENNEGSSLPSDPENAQYLIYLDAGHGWYDNGCSILDRTDIYEKDVTLAITKQMQTALESMGYTVVMARENDVDCVEELDRGVYKSARRIAYANSIGADYYISIHVDNFSDPDVNGTRIYYTDRNDENGNLLPSDALAEQIATSLADKLHIKKPLLKDDRNYNVILLNQMPSVLIEVGFGSSPIDAANMTDPVWQENFARSVALGLDAQVKADNE